MEELTGLPVYLELASDFLDRHPPIRRNDTCIFISQSGETADTLKALEYCKQRNALCMGITNAVGSTIARLTDCGVNLNCGPEIGVASTKAYTSQIIAFLLIALLLGDDSISNKERREAVVRALQELPQKIHETLQLEPLIMEIAAKIYQQQNLLVMARGFQYATCMEAALVRFFHFPQ